jgi:hypothetical protein
MNPDAVTARLDTLRQKRDELLRSRSVHAGLRESWAEWGAHHDRWGRASLSAVSAIEERCGAALPETYRRFVIEIADGGLGPGCGMFSLQEAVDDAPEFTGDLSVPFCYGTGDAQRVLDRRAAGDGHYALDQPNKQGLPHGCLLLAHTGCGCFDVLVLAGEQRDTVWFHDLQRLFPHSQHGRQVSFLDWYEWWVDGWLKSA